MSKSNRKKMKAKTFAIVVSCCLAVLIAFSIALPIVTTTMFDGVLRDFFHTAGNAGATGGNEITDKLDKQYNKLGYTLDQLNEYEQKLVRESGAEGYVLLKNDNNTLPLSKDKTVSLFSHSSVDILAGGTGSGTGVADVTLKDAFEAQGYTVNSTLWNFYASGAGSSYKRGTGSINYGGAEDWSINECPLSVLQSNNVLDSANGTTAIFVLSRTGGEGRDLGRYMGAYTDIEEDKSKHYLEPDSVELGVIDYLNKNFSNVIVIANTNNAVELGWVENYSNISAVLWAPGGGGETANSIVDVLSGAVTPSGHLVDNFAYDAFSSPAMQNFGDIALTSSNTPTGYYGVSYDEGIYIGYKYYETRYYDKVMGQGNAGDYNYATTVQYPYGYGLSYTQFSWSDFTVSDPTADGEITVSVTVKNDGATAGKDVVQVYLNAPYTDYDKKNHLEKAAVSLVGFAKTGTIQPGATETVSVTVDLADFTVYDDVEAKTYILEAGKYLVTAAEDAHAATNNLLAYENKKTSDGMTAEGDASFVATAYETASADTTTYAKSESGATVKNVFGADGNGDDINYIDRTKYLSRQDWVSTFPVMHGKDSGQASGYSERNGNTLYWEITESDLNKLKESGTAEAANTPLTDEQAAAKVLPVGQEGDLELIDYRGLDYNDDAWDDLISQITKSELQSLVNLSGYTTPQMKSINKPVTADLDGPAGINNMVNHSAYSITYPAEVNMAASWNADICYDWGEAVGMDGLRDNLNLNANHCSGWYAPAMNIHRTPFSGRNFEYFSEDSYLSGAMSAEAVSGAASQGMYSFIKHFALNDQEDHRCDNGLATFCNEQTLREIYLKPFQMAVEDSGTVTTKYWSYNEETGEFTESSAQTPACTAVMSAFNRIGYTWAGGDYRLITEVLRGEWGFKGFVLTDYSQGAFSYMHNGQMLRAGGDAALTQYSWGGSLSIDGNALIYYAQQAAKNACYTVVNSNAMNGYVHGVAVRDLPFAYYYLILIAVGVVTVGLTAWGVTAIVLRFRNEKKQNAASDGNSQL